VVYYNAVIALMTRGQLKQLAFVQPLSAEAHDALAAMRALDASPERWAQAAVGFLFSELQ